MHYTESRHNLGEHKWVVVRDLQRRLGRELYGTNISVSLKESHGASSQHELHIKMGQARLARLPLQSKPEDGQHATVEPTIFISKNKTVDKHVKDAIIAAINESHAERLRNEI